MPRMFHHVADAYEAMIDWPRRLENEAVLFRRVFERCNARRVLDAACGTGHHAAMFHSWGLSVEGADLSAEMIERCRARWPEDQRLRWVVRGFDQAVPETFDAVICVGNSLALAPDCNALHGAVRRMLQALRPGGAAVLHVLNLWSLPDGPVKWQKCLRAALPGGERIIIKGVQRMGLRGLVHLLTTPIDPPMTLQADAASFLGVECDDLRQACFAAGAESVECFGGYQRDPYQRDQSTDLIVVAWT